MTQPWNGHRYVVVDVEGNGQRPPDLVEIAIVPVEDGVIGEGRSWLVRPPRPITAMARRIHRIGDDEVAAAPLAGEVAGEIGEHLDGAVFVAHNAHVDLDVIGRAVPGYTPSLVVDTLKAARRLRPGRMSYKLGSLADAFGLADGIGVGLRPHRATYDALICARLLVHLAAPQDGPPLTLADLVGEERTGDAAPTLF
ncbi:3'-5' exonuclease [Actinomadura oligospora]|uniref:3'-5' exonuclease n=1 Tax=Actinomadura oligospora TaxID=111804 RepID=UPI00047AC7CC|nr:3'-5' exonuclease [Actinomadura oligospora]